MELTQQGDSIVKACLEKGVLINCTTGNVLRFIPPLIVHRKEIDQLVDILNGIFSKIS
jgi:4-aminobutyrate aminotransferase-like enzyme